MGGDLPVAAKSWISEDPRPLPPVAPSVAGSQRHRLSGNQGGSFTVNTLFFLESDPHVLPKQWGQTQGAGEGTLSPHSSLSRGQSPC